MKLQAQGFILLTTLLIVLIMSVLLLTSMQQILLFARGLHLQKTQERRFYQLESLAYNLVSRADLDPACLKSQMDANDVLREVARRGCVTQEENHQYRYLMEDLGDYGCLMVKVNQKMYPSHHTRITVVHNNRYIQMRVIKRATQPVACEGEWHALLSGVSSWRYGVVM